jgi:hypothetical protein
LPARFTVSMPARNDLMLEDDAPHSWVAMMGDAGQAQ